MVTELKALKERYAQTSLSRIAELYFLLYDSACAISPLYEGYVSDFQSIEDAVDHMKVYARTLVNNYLDISEKLSTWQKKVKIQKRKRRKSNLRDEHLDTDLCCLSHCPDELKGIADIYRIYFHIDNYIPRLDYNVKVETTFVELERPEQFVDLLLACTKYLVLDTEAKVREMTKIQTDLENKPQSGFGFLPPSDGFLPPPDGYNPV